jgi:hypothetical protein
MLAFIEDEERRFDAAIQLYEQALEITTWEQDGDSASSSQKEMIHYNFACCLAKKISVTEGDEVKRVLANEVVHHIDKCFAISSSKLKYLRADTNEGGDLTHVKWFAPAWSQLMQMLAKLEAEAARPVSGDRA